MDSSDYALAWAVYVAAGILFCWLCWLVLRRLRVRELAWLLQLWLLALLFTPWYVLPDQEILAPALMVFVMDAITVSLESSVRALIPLVMAMMFAAVLTAVMSVVYRLLRRARARA